MLLILVLMLILMLICSGPRPRTRHTSAMGWPHILSTKCTLGPFRQRAPSVEQLSASSTVCVCVCVCVCVFVCSIYLHPNIYIYG